MCSCAKSSFDILDMVNSKRVKAGMAEVNYDWLMVKRRTIVPFMKPKGKIGNNLIWDGKTARNIAQVIWSLPYNPQFISQARFVLSKTA